MIRRNIAARRQRQDLLRAGHIHIDRKGRPSGRLFSWLLLLALLLDHPGGEEAVNLLFEKHRLKRIA
jgi:hypothetical protein